MATIIKTNEVRLSYAHLFRRPMRVENGISKEDPYGVTLLIPKSDTATINAINVAIKECIELNKAGKFGGKTAGLKTPLKDGDEIDPVTGERKYGDEYSGCMHIAVKSYKGKPTVFDSNKVAIQSETPAELEYAQSKVYSGCYALVNFELFAYNADRAKGVSASLRGVLKTRDGESLAGGSVDAYADFGIERPAPQASEFD